MGTVVDLTFKNIKDPEFCRKTSYLLCLTSKSMKFVHQAEFFSGIMESKLIVELLSEHRSDEMICYNTLTIFSFLVIQSWGNEMKSTLKKTIESKVLDIINELIVTSKDDSLVSLCGLILHILSQQSKFKNRIFLFCATRYLLP